VSKDVPADLAKPGPLAGVPQRTSDLAPFGMVMHRNGFYVIGARLKDVDGDVAAAPRGMFALERFAEAEHLRAHEFTVVRGVVM
jgi:hypothetical protein